VLYASRDICNNAVVKSGRYLALAVALAACRTTAGATVARDPQGASVFGRYLESRPRALKLTHAVEARLGGERRTVEGHLVMARDRGFYVQARIPQGPALFELQQLSGTPLSSRTFVDDLEDPRLPALLARDIERVYLLDCPPGSPAGRQADVIVVTCPLASGSPPIAGDPGPDDHLTLVLDLAAELREKRFFRRGAPSARVAYGDYAVHDGVRLADRIDLVGLPLGYETTIVLVAVEPGFDAEGFLARGRP
jgi:hypothetical protein